MLSTIDGNNPPTNIAKSKRPKLKTYANRRSRANRKKTQTNDNKESKIADDSKNDNEEQQIESEDEVMDSPQIITKRQKRKSLKPKEPMSDKEDNECQTDEIVTVNESEPDDEDEEEEEHYEVLCVFPFFCDF